MNPDVEVFNSYIDSWVDIAKGTEATFAMIEGGADVVCSNGCVNSSGSRRTVCCVKRYSKIREFYYFHLP